MEDDAVYRCELLSDSTVFAQETFVFCSKLIYREHTHTHTHTHHIYLTPLPPLQPSRFSQTLVHRQTQ